MTNKKIAIYDDSLRQLDAKYRVFESLCVKGLPCHDLEGMEAWFIAELKNFAQRYPIKALAVSAHGATFVCVGRDNKCVVPCVLYTHEPSLTDDDFHRRFYKRFGKPEELQERTGTPAFKAMINPAKGLFFAREQFSEEFKKVRAVLPYPQYWGLRFTGKTGVESTYMGNHTYLWDQIDHTLSAVAEQLGIASLIPVAAASSNASTALRKSWDVLGTISADFASATGLAKETIVTMGIHDSNSALLPHFATKGSGGFILNSTGTWCVIMNPVDSYGFAPDELGKVVFFNISAFGAPIKTAIFLGGQEFETWSRLIQKKFERADLPGWDEELYRAILKEKRLFLLPELTPGSGQFPHSRARIIEDGITYYFDDLSSTDPRPPTSDSQLPIPDSPFPTPNSSFLIPHSPYESLFAALCISLVMQTLTALERTGIAKNTEVCTEGGFRKNEAYNRLLTSALADNKVYLTDIAEATALGAAMTAKMAMSGKSLAELAGDFRIDYTEQVKCSLPELESYRQAWLDATGMDCRG